MEKIKVKPVEGKRVKDPNTYLLLEGEKNVPKNSYWLRRVADGDVVIVTEVEVKKEIRKKKASYKSEETNINLEAGI